MISKCGQWPLLRCEHPSSPISFCSKYFVFPYLGQLSIYWANLLCSGVSILHHLFYCFLRIWYILYLNIGFARKTIMFCLDVSIPSHIFDSYLNIPAVLYIVWPKSSWANVLWSNMSILNRLFYLILILDIFFT